MKQPPEPDGPHQLRYRDQERCSVEGHLIDGSGACTVIAIRDWKRSGWVLYPHEVAGLGVLITDDAARTLAKQIGRPS